MDDFNVMEEKMKNMEETSENSVTNQKKISVNHINKIENSNEENKNRIQVSNNKKRLLSFYLNLAKEEILFLVLFMFAAIPTAVIIAETLKRNGLATQKQVLISTVGTKDDAKMPCSTEG